MGTRTIGGKSMTHLTLTVADHMQNGFVSLARFRFENEQAAKAAMAYVEAMIDPDAAPNRMTDDYNFILDLWTSDDDGIDETSEELPTQLAMRLARDQVQEWLCMITAHGWIGRLPHNRTQSHDRLPQLRRTCARPRRLLQPCLQQGVA
jgi:hypothetical protein